MTMHRIIIVLVALLPLTGCVSTRPNPAPHETIGVGKTVTLAAGTVAGAAIGHELGGRNGAIVGSVVGLAGTAVASNVLSNRRNSEIEEAKEQARREERVKVMNAYWKEKAIDAKKASSETDKEKGRTAATQQTQYPAGVYDGVEYAPRTLVSPSAD